MRNWIIEYFIGELDEVTLSEEIGFYVVMNVPVIIFMVTMLLMWMGG